jgi:hypothetical protein
MPQGLIRIYNLWWSIDWYWIFRRSDERVEINDSVLCVRECDCRAFCCCFFYGIGQRPHVWLFWGWLSWMTWGIFLGLLLRHNYRAITWRLIADVPCYAVVARVCWSIDRRVRQLIQDKPLIDQDSATHARALLVWAPTQIKAKIKIGCQLTDDRLSSGLWHWPSHWTVNNSVTWIVDKLVNHYNSCSRFAHW